MIDAMQQSDQIQADVLIAAYEDRVNQLQKLTILQKALVSAKDKTLAAIAAQMEANQAEIGRLADMVRALGGEPYSEAVVSAGDDEPA